MTTLIKAWNADENYWVLNPMMKTIKVFKTLYEKDKSKDKSKSSNLMWAIALLVDPNDANPWKNVGISDKLKLIAEDYLGDPKFNWDHPEIVEFIDEYTDRCLTVAEKQLIRFEKKLVQRADFIDSTTYSMDTYDEQTGKVNKGTADQLDKMMVATGKIYDQLADIKAKIQKESAEGTLRGGAAESASENGEL